MPLGICWALKIGVCLEAKAFATGRVLNALKSQPWLFFEMRMEGSFKILISCEKNVQNLLYYLYVTVLCNKIHCVYYLCVYQNPI